jgi:5-methylcytosine-specific restriction endonuclease McrA
MTDNIASTRQGALLLSLPLYQGAPCKRGHKGVRYVGNKACVDCTREQGKARDRNSEAERVRKREGKLSGNWKPEDPAKKAARSRRLRRKAANTTLIPRHAKALALVTGRLLPAMAKAEARAYRESDEWKAEVSRRKAAYNRAKAASRKAFYRGAERQGIIHPRQLDFIRAIQGHACAYCGETDDLHLDHIVPVTKGGQHSFWNLQYLCAFHNISKKAQDDSAYRAGNRIPSVTKWDFAPRLAIWLACFG